MVLWADLMRPIADLIPGVKKPDKDVKVEKKMVYIIAVLLFYLTCSKIPLYGIRPSGTDDPLSYYRIMLASNRGTLMELGISPIVTSGMILQALTGSKLMTLDRNNKEQMRLYGAAEKFIGLITIFAQASFYTLFSGMYGSFSDLGIGNCALIILQLCMSGFIVVLLDDMLQAGYGFGSAISLFISTNICESIAWQVLSFRTVPTVMGNEYEGALINLAYALTGGNTLSDLKNAFFRESLPNVSNLLATVVVFCVVVYFQGFRVEIPIRHTSMRSGTTNNSYPIKLFYTSTVPIMIQSAFTSTIFMVSSVMHSRFRGFGLANLFGRWVSTPSGRSIPIGGLVYYLSAPRSLTEAAMDPVHTLIYIAYVLGSCSIFSTAWLEFSGSSAKDVAKNLRSQGLTVLGYRQNSMQTALERYIPTAAAFGGLCTGTLSIFGEFLGAMGSGTGILLAVNMILDYVEKARKESEKAYAKSSGGILPGVSSIFS